MLGQTGFLDRVTVTFGPDSFALEPAACSASDSEPSEPVRASGSSSVRRALDVGQNPVQGCDVAFRGVFLGEVACVVDEFHLRRGEV